MKKLSVLLVCLFLLLCSPGYGAEDDTMSEAQFESSLKYQTGEVVLPGGIATLKVPDSFRYLGPEDAERVLVDAWGNPSGNETLGMLFPAKVNPTSENGWGVVITYDEDGYVSDDDADSINYDDLLKTMQEQVAEANEGRKKEGFKTLLLVGWAAKPHYDKESHKLYWAKELKFENNPGHTLNYNVRVLGRKGVLVLNAVSGMDQLGTIENEMQKVIAFTDFNAGYRYGDYDAKTDKTAAYGLAALVAGGVAAKAGFFTKILAIVLAAKKLIFVGAAALIAGVVKFFKRKD